MIAPPRIFLDRAHDDPLEGHRDLVRGLSFGAGGRVLASAGKDGKHSGGGTSTAGVKNAARKPLKTKANTAKSGGRKRAGRKAPARKSPSRQSLTKRR